MGVNYRHSLIHKAAKPLVCLNKAIALLKGILQHSFPPEQTLSKQGVLLKYIE